MSAARHFPRPASVRGRIAGSFLRGEQLTQLDALRRFGNFRLAADVETLRKRGWSITTEMIEVCTSDAGRCAEVARYSMPVEAIAEAGEEGRQYAEDTRLAENERRSA